jgi:hypothetical protein
MDWIDFPDERLVVNGLPWFGETTPNLWRLPERMKDRVRPPVWDLSLQPSGGRIRFATDATAIGVRLQYPGLGHMNNMCRIGQMGVDLYAGPGTGCEYWRTVFPLESAKHEELHFEGAPAARREICLYLPLYHPVQVVAVGVSDGATLDPPAPFAAERPVVYYGSSITQGGCASRPGLSYQAQVSRWLNLDFVNLGFSGNGCGEPELAEAVAETEASCYVIDFCQNVATVGVLAEAYAPFLSFIREHRPTTPMVCITPIFCTQETWSEAARLRLEGMREVIRTAVADRQVEGDRTLALMEGYDLLGPGDRDGLVDASHPNDIGFERMARGLAPTLRRMLARA